MLSLHIRGSLSIFHIIASGLSQSFSNRRDKTLSKLTKLAVNNRRFDVRAPDSPAVVSNQVNFSLHQDNLIHVLYILSIFYSPV